MNLFSNKQRLARRLSRATTLWRRLVTRIARPNHRSSNAEAEAYTQAHREVLSICAELAEQESGTQASYTIVADGAPTSCQSGVVYGAKQPDTLPGELNGNQRLDSVATLMALLSPWKNPKAVHEAPKAIVDDLLAQERSLESRILGHSSGYSRPSLQLIIVAFVIAATFGTFMASLSSVLESNSATYAQEVGYTLINRFRNSTSQERLYILAIIPWIVGTILLWTTNRR